ncbi:hypothetical protein pb186bvf_012709 [Paramecium bursaria]
MSESLDIFNLQYSSINKLFFKKQINLLELLKSYQDGFQFTQQDLSFHLTLIQHYNIINNFGSKIRSSGKNDEYHQIIRLFLCY